MVKNELRICGNHKDSSLNQRFKLRQEIEDVRVYIANSCVYECKVPGHGGRIACFVFKNRSLAAVFLCLFSAGNNFLAD